VINDVEYTPQGQSTKAKGDLEIIKAAYNRISIRIYQTGKEIEILEKYKVAIFDKVKIITKDESLPLRVVESFSDKYYYTAEVMGEFSVYRRFGGDGTSQAKLLGGFSSTEAVLSRNDLAILKKWSNMQFEAEIVVQKGAKLNLGKVAPQVGYSGGADQILLPLNYPESWVKNVKDLKTGKIYTIEEFKKQFPQLIK